MPNDLPKYVPVIRKQLDLPQPIRASPCCRPSVALSAAQIQLPPPPALLPPPPRCGCHGCGGFRPERCDHHRPSILHRDAGAAGKLLLNIFKKKKCTHTHTQNAFGAHRGSPPSIERALMRRCTGMEFNSAGCKQPEAAVSCFGVFSHAMTNFMCQIFRNRFMRKGSKDAPYRRWCWMEAEGGRERHQWLTSCVTRCYVRGRSESGGSARSVAYKYSVIGRPRSSRFSFTGRDFPLF